MQALALGKPVQWSSDPTALPAASRLTPLANDPPTPSSSASQSEVSSTRAGWTDDGPLTPPHPCPWLASGLPATLTSESRPVHHPLSFLLLYFSAVTTPFSGSGLIRLGDGHTCLPHPLISTGLERSLAPVPSPPVLDNVPSSIGAISPSNGPTPDPFKSKTARPRTPFKSNLGMSLSETGSQQLHAVTLVQFGGLLSRLTLVFHRNFALHAKVNSRCPNLYLPTSPVPNGSNDIPSLLFWRRALALVLLFWRRALARHDILNFRRAGKLSPHPKSSMDCGNWRGHAGERKRLWREHPTPVA